MSKMSNREFDKKVRELMEAHTEMPPVGSWDLIALSLSSKKRTKALYFRRALYSTVAVAASLILLLVLNKSSYDFNDSIKVIEQNETIANLEIDRLSKEKSLQSLDSPTAKTTAKTTDKPTGKSTDKSINKAAYKIEQAQAKLGHSTKLSESKETVTEKQIVVEKKVLVKNEEAQDVKKSQDSYLNEKNESESRLGYPALEDYKRVSRRKSSPLVAFATNISPSTGNNSVSLMAMSQMQGGFAANDVVSTIQKAYVPQEVVSNTKFLMPVSVGVQVQMPLSKLFSVGLGVNYTLLFSNYDALSRQETRQTQQTLHYIGIPLNLYANILQKDNLRFYATGGVTLEKGLYAFYRVSENGVTRSTGEIIEGLQWSATGGVGVEFAVNNNTGLYFDPTVAYYFDNNQPLSIRTSQPLQFKFELGFRFHL